MNKQIQWGIMGTGRIANAFAEGLQNTTNGKLQAIGSRNQESAQKFAKQWNIPTAYNSYEELASSKSVDAIYVATPHTEHAENAILCMIQGKAVLCEKPFAVNS